MNNSKAELFGEIIASVIVWAIVIATGFLTTTYQAFVLGQMWDWFIVPAGLGLESLAFSVRVGAALIFNLFMVNVGVLISVNSSKEGGNATGAAFTGQIIVVVVVTMAWISAAVWTWLLS